MEGSFIINIFKNTKLFLFIIILLGLIYRIGCFVLLEDGFFITNKTVFPMEERFLREVVGPSRHDVTRYVAEDMPLWPLILLLSHKVSGGVLPARILNIFLSLFTCLVVYFIGKELSGKTIGKIAAFMYVFYYPPLRWMPTAQMETFQTFITSLSIYYMITALTRNNFKSYTIAGVWFALSILTKPVPFIFLPVFITLILFKNRAFLKKALIYSLVFISINILFLTPWVIRNFHYHHRFIPFSTHGGQQFLFGNQVHFTGGDGGWLSADEVYTRYPELEDVALPKPANPNLAMLDNYYYRLGFEFIKRYPKIFLELIPLKFYNMWRFSYPGIKNPLRIISELFGYLFMLPFFLFMGIYYLRPRNFFKEVNPCLIPFLFVIMHMLFFMVYASAIRYRLPLMHCIQIVGLCGIELTIKIFKGKDNSLK